MDSRFAHDKAGNAWMSPIPKVGVVFPDLNSPPLGGEQFQTNLIFPEPCDFLKGESCLPARSSVPLWTRTAALSRPLKPLRKMGCSWVNPGPSLKRRWSWRLQPTRHAANVGMTTSETFQLREPVCAVPPITHGVVA